jgi:alkanesulfonate monooxygenase SsuD/methylene tetrahydromethanopterin reductase-like flavin-dependent oxidoreductase (luciferase family)
MKTDLRLGLLIWSHATDWPAMLATAQLADHLGYDHVWTSDHLLATVGDPFQPILEGWSIAAAWAALLRRVRIGLLVSANTFRHPALLAKIATTVDHISGGRAILGLGAGWFRLEHTAHGIAFGATTGERLAWLDEGAGILRRLLDGETVTHHGPHYHLDSVRHSPRPVQTRLPLMIGGGGERHTLRTVARHADLWNVFGPPQTVAHKATILDHYCAEIGRDPTDIERSVTVKVVIRDSATDAQRIWRDLTSANGMDLDDHPDVLLGPPTSIAAVLQQYRAHGVATVIADAPAPYDRETIERLATEVPSLMSERNGQTRRRSRVGDQ